MTEQGNSMKKPGARAEPGVRPLVVDLDGTLLKTDLLVESFLHLLARKPLSALKALGALGQGKAALKAKLADEAVLDLHLMPVDPAIAALIAERRKAGGDVILASASDERYVRALAEHLGWFGSQLRHRRGHQSLRPRQGRAARRRIWRGRLRLCRQ